MNIIEPKVYIVQEKKDPNDSIRLLERLGRVCYASEGNITPDSFNPFVAKRINQGHEAVIEFQDLIFIFRVDRGISHELVRHRIASFAQESTRYCNYSREIHGETGVRFIRPFFLEGGSQAYKLWTVGVESAEQNYLEMLKEGRTPQEARSLLPNSTKTLICMKMDFREARHFFGLRCDKPAHPQMRQVTIPAYRWCKSTYPAIFGDMPDWELPTTRENEHTLTEADLADLQILSLDFSTWPEEL